MKTLEIRYLLADLESEVITKIDVPLMSKIENYNCWMKEEGISLPFKDNVIKDGVEIEI